MKGSDQQQDRVNHGKIFALLRRHRFKVGLIAALLMIWTTGILFIPESATLPNPYATESKKIISNCDMGSACGNGPLIAIALGVAVLTVAVGGLRRVLLRFNDR